MKELSPKQRASIATAIFSAFGVVGIFLSLNNLEVACVPILFYILLVWNDYFSIAHFSKIISPKKISQIMIDGILVILHFISIFFFTDPEKFTLIMVLLFVFAVIKYAWDLPTIHNSRALYRKIKIDSLGALIASLALTGMIFGYPWSAMVIWVGIFICASIYVIFINPLYKDTIGPS